MIPKTSHCGSCHTAHDPEASQQHYYRLIIKTISAAILGIFLIVISMSNLISLHTTSGYWINIIISLVTLGILIYAGGHYFSGAWQALQQKKATMNTLIAMGTGIAWLYSIIVLLFISYIPAIAQHVYFETAVVIIALVNLGHVLEMRAKHHTSTAIANLIKLQPKTARVIRDHEEIDVALTDLHAGDLIRVHPGEQIPVDGVVIEGSSTIDESMITGESLPSDKIIGDQVIGGTLNITGSFIFKAEHVGNQTMLAKIIQLVQRAQSSKPALARLADKISAVFVPIVILIAILTAIVWFNSGVEDRIAYMLVTAMAVLVIACPCALGLAVPISVMIGIGKAAEYGILIKNADALQQTGQLTTIILDKTGTITLGKPEVTLISPVSGSNTQQILTYAASLEVGSEHPIAQAIVNAAKQAQCKLLAVTRFHATAGHGVSGIIQNQPVCLGNARFMEQQQIEVVSLKQQTDNIAAAGKTPIYVAVAQQLIGILTIADPIKPDAKAAIRSLQNMGLTVLMITGDHQQTAANIAKEVGITEVIAEILPIDKAQKVAQLQAQDAKVGMVGDGINDAPALAQADVGFAIGTGTDVAIESADITLMRGSLNVVAEAIAISKQTSRNMKQNLAGAFIYNIIGIPIAAGVLYPFIGLLLNPMIAGAAMALSSLTVVLNANRLRWFKASKKNSSSHKHP